ncbi:putative peptidoglycan D,D-transpeptidase FtsI [Alphaproteobacteria bacterium SO-S41]|nr:putative peptidoglycan D,D-transpeptidase FtsI [Alphaproteobacteria bacterium SO-S41]
MAPSGEDPRARRLRERADPARGRVAFCAAVFVGVFSLIGARMVQIALFNDGGEKGSALATVGPIGRPDILDRNGVILATDLSVASVYADPRSVWDAAETARALATVFPELNVEELTAKLSTKTAFVWIKRDITPRQHAAVHDLGLAGIDFRQELKRVYPNGRAAAHVIGFVDVDNKGLGGIERAIDTTLADKVAHGEPVRLSIDVRVQHVVEDELAKTVQTFSAIGGAGLVMDVQTGEVIAMVSLPDFDPNHVMDDPAENRFNRNTLGVYEMGSTFKSFNTAMALDAGVSSKDYFDARGSIRIGRFTIKDYHPMGRALTVEEIFEHSSNVGSANMARKFGEDHQKSFLASLGQLEPMPLELPERGAPLYPKNWGEVAMLTISFGHGIAVSPMHVVTGVSAMANGGMFIQPTVLMRDAKAPLPEHRVLKEETSSEMNRLFRLVVEKGTARKADVPGYPVGGKTGTAEKISGRGYAHKTLLSSFIGVFPANKPQYAVLVIVDEPKGTKETSGFATGGWTAAPATSRIVARIAPMLGVEPTRDPNAAPPVVAKADSEADAVMLAQDH